MSFIDKWLQSDIAMKIFTLAGKFKDVEFVKKAMEVVDDVQATADEIEAAVKEVKELSWQGAVARVADFLEDKPLDDNIGKILTKVVKALKLKDDLKPIKKFWQDLPQKYRDLFTAQLKDLPEPLEWKIVNWESDAKPIKGPWASVLNIGAKANLSFDMAVMAEEKAVLCGDPPPADSKYFRMGLKGGLGASADVPTVTSGVVSFGAGASAAGNLTLDYFYTNSAEGLVIQAAANGALHLPSPLSAAGIYTASTHKLKAVHLTAFGSLGASVNVNAGTVFDSAFDVASKALKLNKTIKVSGSVKAGYEASFKWQGNWDVLTCPQSNNIVKVTLKRGSQTTKSSAFTLDATLGITGLDAVGDAILKTFVPDAQPLIDKLEGLQNFGQDLKDKLRDYIMKLLKEPGDENIKTKLADIVLGNTTAVDVAQGLGQKIEDTINGKLDILEGDAQTKADDLLRGLGGKLKLPQEVTDFLVGKAGLYLTELLGGLKSMLQDKIGSIVDMGAAEAGKLLQPLDAVGAKVNEIVADINNAATKLTQPLIDFLKKYNEIRATIQNAVKKTAQLKLGLHFGHKVEVSRIKDALLVFELDTSVEATGDYYRQMIIGNFNNAIKIWREDKDGTSGVKLVSGTLKDTFTKTVTTDFSMNIFGMNYASKSVFNSNITTSIDPVGNVCVATDKAELTKYKAWRDESQTVQFVNVLEVAGTANSAQTKTMSSGIDLTYSDKRMEKSELVTYLGSLEKVRLLPPGTVDIAEEIYDKLPVTGENTTSATIGVNMPLSSDDIKTMVQHDADSTRLPAAINLCTAHFPDKERYGKFENAVKKLAEKNGIPVIEFFKVVIKLGAYYGAGVDPSGPNIVDIIDNATYLTPAEKHDILRASFIGYLAEHFVKFFTVMKKAANLDINSGSSEMDLTSELEELDSQLHLTLNKLVKAGPSEKIYYGTIGFMMTVANLCGRDQQVSSLIPTIEWDDKEGNPQKALVVKN